MDGRNPGSGDEGPDGRPRFATVQSLNLAVRDLTTSRSCTILLMHAIGIKQLFCRQLNSTDIQKKRCGKDLMEINIEHQIYYLFYHCNKVPNDVLGRKTRSLL